MLTLIKSILCNIDCCFLLLLSLFITLLLPQSFTIDSPLGSNLMRQLLSLNEPIAKFLITLFCWCCAHHTKLGTCDNRLLIEVLWLSFEWFTSLIYKSTNITFSLTIALADNRCKRLSRLLSYQCKWFNLLIKTRSELYISIKIKVSYYSK